jgi:hypothetical protein
MRTCKLLLLMALAGPAFAQDYYIPDNDASTGTSNTIPFGSSLAGSSSQNCRMQMRATAAQLGGLPNVITGLSYASAATGAATYGSLTIVMDHIPSAQALTTTFANNLTANAVTVLSAPNYTWNVTANTWNEVGLQNFFTWNGVDDVLIDITTSQGFYPSGGVRRTSSLQRLFTTSATGPLSATGSLSNTGLKFEVSMLTARTSTYGKGCVGSNGTPKLDFSGSAQVGGVLSIDLQNGVPNGIAMVVLGLTNAAPLPLELGFLDMPGCYLFIDLPVTDAILLDGIGAGSYPISLAPSAMWFGFLFYAQFACLDPAANLFGFTSSSYGRVVVGT